MDKIQKPSNSELKVMAGQTNQTDPLIWLNKMHVRIHYPCCFLCLHFDPEDGRNTFLRNVGKVINYAA
jgi:hypothetical protein